MYPSTSTRLPKHNDLRTVAVSIDDVLDARVDLTKIRPTHPRYLGVGVDHTSLGFAAPDLTRNGQGSRPGLEQALCYLQQRNPGSNFRGPRPIENREMPAAMTTRPIGSRPSFISLRTPARPRRAMSATMAMGGGGGGPSIVFAIPLSNPVSNPSRS